jgi:hypothetical protein
MEGGGGSPRSPPSARGRVRGSEEVTAAAVMDVEGVGGAGTFPVRSWLGTAGGGGGGGRGGGEGEGEGGLHRSSASILH